MIKLWQETKKSSKIHKLRNTIVLNSFSANCGKEHGSIYFDYGSYTLAVAPTFSKASLNAITSTLTAEIWFRPNRSGSNLNVPALININRVSDGLQVFCLQLSDIASDPANDGKIVAFITNSGGTVYTITSAVNLVKWNQWQCLSVTFDSVAQLLSLYLDGVLIGSHATTGTITGVSKLYCIGGSAEFGTSPGTSYYLGYISDVRIWNQCLTATEVLNRYNKPRGLDGVIDSNLVLYYRFTELAGITLNNALAALIPATLTPPYQTWSTTQKAPIIFGASFIAGRYTVTLASDSSIKYPLTKPTTDCNFELIVMWVDDEGTVQRRSLWETTGVDIAPIPAKYRGERLPTTFYLECWCIDGNATIDLAANYTIEMSLLTLPTSSIDLAEPNLGSYTIDTTIAQNFPLVFPLTFNSQQAY